MALWTEILMDPTLTKLALCARKKLLKNKFKKEAGMLGWGLGLGALGLVGLAGKTLYDARKEKMVPNIERQRALRKAVLTHGHPSRTIMPGGGPPPLVPPTPNPRFKDWTQTR